MTIAFLTNTIDPHAGWGRYAGDIIEGARRAGHTVVVLTERDSGQEGHAILERRWGIFRAAFRARKYLKQCDIVHALDGYPYAVIAALACVGLRKPLVVTAQGTYAVAPLYNWHTATLLSWAYRRADRIIAISRYTKDLIAARLPDIAMTVIPHGIDLAKFERPHEPSSEPFVLSVGTVEDRKGYHVAIPAFAHAAREIPGLTYHIVGRQERWYLAELERCAKEERVWDKITFHEHISDESLVHLYQTARVFLLPSLNIDRHHFEGFGLVFLEAAAAGLPVIGTLGNGIADAVDDGVNSILVPQNDVEKTAQAIVRICSDDVRWQDMSRASSAWARAHDLERTVRRYLDIYESL